MALEIKNLTKQYNKHKTGLADYTLTIEKGILGLLGPNGAGKSTLMKIIATISKPTSGTVPRAKCLRQHFTFSENGAAFDGQERQ